jgi:hypothetical protein
LTLWLCIRVSASTVGWPYELPLPHEITHTCGVSALSQLSLFEYLEPWWCALYTSTWPTSGPTVVSTSLLEAGSPVKSPPISSWKFP